MFYRLPSASLKMASGNVGGRGHKRASAEVEGRPGAHGVTSGRLHPPRSRLYNGWSIRRFTALCSEVQRIFVTCSAGHVRAWLSSPPRFRNIIHLVPDEASYAEAFALHHSHLASCQCSYTHAGLLALDSATFLHLLCGACGHF